ncbi:LacI family DNA-binding transcriptional regulator [Paractinoplanes abujensis]|uniref:DNA-binding LacI/PurR family transcriptional regulator n=1 Tax=Paractinoplanes abujensis TaxID=882441 RepID=A0A7W7CZ86_9ACTN|nr:LacI family DNA-binding transcriptional regulator [Actinoplanes abujensis]MBB4697362.1 DNA-binding LacI/PurR family transcriptional regulator [Actinoplanes abujensis]
MTIATVARRAGVSRQTVSNVINTPDVVRAETRERVREAIEELGYRVNQAARQMRTGRSRLIAVRIEPARDGINGSVLDRFLHGLTDAAGLAGYRVMLYTADGDADEIATYDELLNAYDLDAFVLTSTHHGDPRTSWLAARDVPFVTFGRPWGAPDTHSWVDIDNAAGTAAATEHLLAAGHRRIGFLGWPAGSGVGDARREGWHRALGPWGSSFEATDSVESGAAGALSLLRAEEPPTALVCASDSLALGALQAARELGRDCAVIGFDDTAVAQAIGLTSVSQPLAEAAARCMGLLAELLDGRAPSFPTTVLLPPSLVVRQTA